MTPRTKAPKCKYEKPITPEEIDRIAIKTMLKAKWPIEQIYAYLKVGKLISEKSKDRKAKREWLKAIEEFRSLDR